MILENTGRTGQWVYYRIAGYTKKVYLAPFSRLNVAEITHQDQINFTPIDVSIKHQIDIGKNFRTNNIPKIEIITRSSSAPISITMTFTDLAAFIAAAGITNDVAGWNSFFDTTTYADTPFTSIETSGNEVVLYGATNLELKDNLFFVSPRGGTSRLLTFIDTGIVTTIGDTVFANHNTITQVSFPSVDTIGVSVFSDCTSLTDCGTWSSLVTLSFGVFVGCTSLATFSFPVLTTIGQAAFSSCVAILSISSTHFPVVTSIGNDSFQFCIGLTTVNLSTVTFLDNGAFDNCSALENTSLPLVTTINKSAFASNTAMTTLSIPSATSLGSNVFDSIAGQTITLTIPAALNLDANVTALQAANTVTIINP